jgi:hypothetical protein
MCIHKTEKVDASASIYFICRMWNSCRQTPEKLNIGDNNLHQFSEKLTQNSNKGKVVPVLSVDHEGVWGNKWINPHILDLSTRWSWVVSFTHRPLLSPGKYPTNPLDRPQNLYGRRGEEKILPLLGLKIRLLCRPAHRQPPPQTNVKFM